ncbi:hypothetical protein HOLleu_43312 [Holothuria leucospilota]|uniref:Uncharacterized protein n=1 Tax=Holothuria leucospilota TaxID=206669 RepID=A0A9Q1B9R9_HOLLE|nr:hypothetical protein HOLleu_43312 [Holothuria leucospilota]
MEDVFRECNLIWRFSGNIDDIARHGLMIDAGVSGVGYENNLIDTHTLHSILLYADRLDPNRPPEEEIDLAPLAKMIYGLSFTKAMVRDYINGEQNIPYVDTVRAITKHMLPQGLLMVKGDDGLDVVANTKMFHAKMLTKGYVNDLNRVTMQIPLDHTIDHMLLKSESGDLNLYYVIGPHNELLVGPGAGNENLRAASPARVIKGRRVQNMVKLTGDPTTGKRNTQSDPTTIVYDQQLTGAFVFTKSTQNIEYVLSHMAARCLKYSACKHLADKSCRTIGAIFLATIFKDDKRHVVTTSKAGNESLMLSNFYFCKGSQWKYRDFFYEKNDFLGTDTKEFGERVSVVDTNYQADPDSLLTLSNKPVPTSTPQLPKKNDRENSDRIILINETPKTTIREKGKDRKQENDEDRFSLFAPSTSREKDNSRGKEAKKRGKDSNAGTTIPKRSAKVQRTTLLEEDDSDRLFLPLS